MDIPDSVYDYRPSTEDLFEHLDMSPVDNCCLCGKDIFEGEEYYDAHGFILCKECVVEDKEI